MIVPADLHKQLDWIAEGWQSHTTHERLRRLERTISVAIPSSIRPPALALSRELRIRWNTREDHQPTLISLRLLVSDWGKATPEFRCDVMLKHPEGHSIVCGISHRSQAALDAHREHVHAA